MHLAILALEDDALDCAEELAELGAYVAVTVERAEVDDLLILLHAARLFLGDLPDDGPAVDMERRSGLLRRLEAQLGAI